MKHAMGLVAALLVLFSLSSCIEKNAYLGSALVPSNQDIKLKTATFEVPVDLRMADSLQSSIANSATVGSIRTRAFGLFHSDAAMTITAGSDSISWGSNPTVRRIYLALVRDTTIAIDAAQLNIPQNLNLYYLTTELDSTHRYNCCLSDADHEPESLLEGSVPYMGEDEYTVDLKKEFGERFFRLPSSTLDSADLMAKAMCGLYLTCDDPEETLEGGRLNLFDLSSSALYLSYDYTDTDGSRKSKTVTFLVGDKQAVNICSSSSDKLVTDNPSDVIYMEGLCGIKPHINATRLREMVVRWAGVNGIPLKNLVIAKATLSFPFEYNGDTDMYDAWSENLFPCQRLATKYGYPNYSPIDEIEDSTLEDGSIDRMKLEYKSNISLYLQDLLSMEADEITAEDDLWMMPYLTISDSSSGSVYYYSDYFYYQQDYLNGTGALRRPVLHLTYTVLE